MKQYLDYLQDILDNGKVKMDRTGTGTIGVFGRQMRFDLSEGFPLVTTKKVHWDSIVGELLWFISGSTSAKELREKYGVTIWDEWQDENGELGPVYGKQWRKWDTGKQIVTMWDSIDNDGKWSGGRDVEPIVIDQLKEAIETIKTNPDSRRIVVSAWNPVDIPHMALPPCHMLFQFYVEPLREGETKRRLSMQMYQRSVDSFLGLSFNIASYALLIHLVAQVCDLDVGEFVWTGGDCHIYLNHIEQVKKQLSREPKPLPTLLLNRAVRDIDEYTTEDIRLVNYNPHPGIKGAVSV